MELNGHSNYQRALTQAAGSAHSINPSDTEEHSIAENYSINTEN